MTLCWSFLIAGVAFKNFFRSSAPCSAVPPTISPIFASPAPYFVFPRGRKPLSVLL
uniref:Uncharacterized protein n=1 Tax=Caudovirales sp. ct2KA10 TaxID=2825757 RepID=A0A8S5U4M1_9CAUD|nr:MAG TPA: hypothetical protein [Caudovirales sp. ct2KA10]